MTIFLNIRALYADRVLDGGFYSNLFFGCKLKKCLKSKTVIEISDLFRLCHPQYVMLCSPQLQSTCHYIVNHYVKILHVHLGVANNMHPQNWGGGGGTNGKDPKFQLEILNKWYRVKYKFIRELLWN